MASATTTTFASTTSCAKLATTAPSPPAVDSAASADDASVALSFAKVPQASTTTAAASIASMSTYLGAASDDTIGVFSIAASESKQESGGPCTPTVSSSSSMSEQDPIVQELPASMLAAAPSLQLSPASSPPPHHAQQQEDSTRATTMQQQPKRVRIITDILTEVFKFLCDDPDTLQSCALVCRSWCAPASSTLLRSPRPRSVWALRRLVSMLASDVSCRRRIKKIDLSGIRTTIPANDLTKMFAMLPCVCVLDLSYCRELTDAHIRALTNSAIDGTMQDYFVDFEHTQNGHIVQDLRHGDSPMTTSWSHISRFTTHSVSTEFSYDENHGYKSHYSKSMAVKYNGPKLVSLTLAANRHITDASIARIAQTSNSRLRSLCIDDCPGVTNSALAIVAAYCTHLDTIKLASTGTSITDAGLAAFAVPIRALCCTTLHTLQLYDCPNLTDVSLCAIAHACPGITAVELYRLPFVSDAALVALARHTQVQNLCIGEMRQVTDTSLCELGRQCDLRALTVSHCEAITDRGIVEAVRNSPNMRFLDLGLVDSITLVSLVATAQCCPLLKDLVVSGNLHAEEIPTSAVFDVVRAISRLESLTIFQSRDITLDDIETLARECPNIRSVFIRQCVNISPSMADNFSKLHRLQLVVR